MTLVKWKVKNRRCKNYTHFDERVDLKHVWYYIKEPNNISKHGFFPFLHYKQVFCKFKKGEGKTIKERDIYYSAHLDRYIFSYYSFKLNQIYNKRVLNDGIDDSQLHIVTIKGKAIFSMQKKHLIL